GVIPEHWEVKKLKYLVKGNLKYGANESGIEYNSDLPRYIRITDFTEGGKLNEEKKLSLKWEVGKEYLLSDGDILFARSGATVGKSYQFKESMSTENCCAFAGYLIKASPNENLILSDFLNYFTNSDCFNSWKQAIFNKATIENIGADKYSQLVVIVPPLEKQATIANFLDEKCGKIDLAITQKQKLIKLLKERKQILIQNAVTKGLDPNVKMKNSGVDWIGEIPEHWKLSKLGFYINILSGYAFPSAGFVSSPGIKLLRGINVAVNNVRWSETVYWPEYKTNDLQSYLLKVDDIIFGMDRPLISEGMRIATIQEKDLPCLLLQRVTRIRAIKGLFQEYLLLIIRSKQFIDYFLPILSGVSVPHISPDQIESFKLCVPPLKEQNLIVNSIKTQSTKIDKAIALQEQQIEKLKEYKASLINSAVTGKIKVS
ncbi:MAG: restriction endonuclease subunit S, partial [Labilibaculum sp.]|nr:restriction endonuclease subunit S [Labilibaculum sp.]